MMTNQQTIVEPEATPARSVVLRHVPLCIAWLVLAAVGVGLAFVLEGPMQLLPALLGAYAVQGFVAEMLGVRIDAESIVLPRRFMSVSPFLVLWRERIPLTSVERIASKRPWLGIEWASVSKGYNERASIVFSSRDQKMYFFKIIKDFQPTLGLYRSN